MMWMDESGRHEPVDGSRGALLKLHPDIRLNRLANWTCLLAVAPIYVHSLLQLVHLHYWNGLSSGLDRGKGRERGGTYRRIMNNVENKHIWGIGAGWQEWCCECCEMPGFYFFSLSLSHSISLSLHVIVCAASASGCWCCGSSVLGLCLTHMQLGINTHTHTQRPHCTSTSSSRRWALAGPL